MSGLKRIVAHWTVGKYTANAIDRKHYHFIVEGDGNIVEGDHKPEANIKPVSGRYAAHTRALNTGSIGVSMASMHGAQWPDKAGPYPFTEAQFNAMCKLIAGLCKRYNIAVTPQTVLSHAEVQPTLGVKQNGKWDFTIIPFMPHVKGAKACGDEMRRRVNLYIDEKPVVANSPIRATSDSRIAWLQRLLTAHGYPHGNADGIVGRKTRVAIMDFQRDNGLTETGEFDRATVDLLKADPEKPKVPTPIIAALVALITAIAAAFGGDAADIIKLIGG